MTSAKDSWHPADQREQPPPPGHLPPSQSQSGRQSPSGIHRYQPPPSQGNFYQAPPPTSQAGPQAAPQSQLPHLPGLSSGQPPYPLPSLQGGPQGPPHPHILDRPHETRPPHSQIPQLASPPIGIGQQQQSGPGHLYPASHPPNPQQQPSAQPQDRLGPITPANNAQPLPAIASHPLQALAQLPQQGGPQPPQPHQEAVATIVNAQPAGLVNIPIGAQASIPPSYRPLNVKDALSYLDQVKVQFAEHPNVYNQFLDIMKDFKSQAIDTPGVIERVSTLFAGNPNLIQGFNTFLPPGYRIECSSDPSDPHSIRVTTPQGTTTATSGLPPNLHLQGVVPPAGQVNGGWRQQDAWGEPAGARFRFSGDEPGPSERPPPGEPMRAGQVQGRPGHPMANQPAQLQQPQPLQANSGQPSGIDTVNQLQNAVAAANGTGPLAGGQMRQAPPNGPLGQPVANGPLTPGADVKRGPVEFNHAISYVNKIKTRFSSQPEIYKNFLEILQTYQRESKPIQEVYSQVTQLFNAAPDLLEDFKQFLPESAAQARQKPDDHPREMNGMGGPGGRGPPPQGHFAPPLAAPKDTGKRKRPAQPVLSNSRDSGIAPLPNNPLHDLNVGPSPGPRGAAANKRPKIMHKAAEAPVSPTLIPAPPTPLLPADPVGATGEEIAFFDRVRKYIGNKQTYNEFLKLLNLFSQDLMDKSLLIVTLETFLGSNPELFNWIKRFLGIQDKAEDSVQNALKKSQKVRLNVCRALGPSYRLLPKLEATKPCSGRDDMCREVLNDEWASHPTWASEDSGFVGHKKNQYEEMLHRVEEERHDYDFHIEANLRTIQLLEPINQRIATMTNEEKANFRLSPGLGGQSRTIYQRCIKKVYRDDGLETIKQLHEQPAYAVPIILRRLKQKDEEWRFAQREWNRVWREQTGKIFYKSLDHQGNTFKQNDKRNTTNRHFNAEIDALYKVADASNTDKSYHLKFSFPDLDVLLDICRLLSTQLEKDGAYSYSERQKISQFIRNFIPTFFGINKDDVESAIGSFSRKSPDEDVDMDHADSSSGRRKNKESNLLQDVLKRSRGGKTHKADGTGSRGSTPELSNEDDLMEVDGLDSEPVPPNAPATWINPTGPSRPSNGIEALNTAPGTDARDVVVSELKERNVYNLFANGSIYCFMRLLQSVYQRLLDVKSCEEVAKVTLSRRKNNTTARKLGLIPQAHDEFFTVTDDANYYQQVLEHAERLILGNIDSNVFEDGMRSVYIQKGWQLYTIDKHIATLNKTIQTFVGDGGKENSNEILKLFDRDRAEEKTNFQLQMSYRRDVELFIGREEPTYRIEWNTETKEMAIQLLFRVDPTHTAKLTKDEKWSYYVDSYIMAQPTEGVDVPKKPPFLPRNLPAPEAIDSFSSRDCELSGSYSYKKPIIQEGLELKICVNTYKLYFTPGTTDVMIMSGESRQRSLDAEKRGTSKRKRVFESEYVNSRKKLKDALPEDVVLGFDEREGLWKP
ncbi:Transcriptional regulatory protein sin3 [Orbilia oligospora]|uniref:Transcriptional regulatory protein sin3 n=1 Tax=Orbilia oligospora TaxID=2813651 RepID=A0A7C8J4R7_ORBOL|nr:Transcriptional regulatory protein sin3 [Orbilia oligospora]KAF3094135.1 Transcriptional regulatory protein sin3 [Orbilia oligospora]KAF3138680.1 Transcriptional regulatory protein sin3 [Orbilia oligospora]KAF3144452.1 Transcriptional regulatory protein sin3 [Orbilia oligospora]